MRLFTRMVAAFCAVIMAFGLILHLQRKKSAEAEEPSLDVDATEAAHVTRFLVMGKDRSAGLTDTIFLVTLDEDARQARILQIPRDTYAKYTDRDYKKLNGALNALGESGVKEMLSRALGVPIDFFVILDLSCLSAVVDAIGGVEVNVPQDMTYSDPAQGLEICLQAGMNHLDGRAAEHFVRYRSGYINADLGRLDAQKLFLQAFAKKCRSLTASQLLRVTCLALTKVQTDIGLPEAIRVVSLLRSCNADDIPMATLAGQAVQGSSGAWYYAVNREGAYAMVREYLLPSADYSEESFDRERLFDRADYDDFHKIYASPYGCLPLG